VDESTWFFRNVVLRRVALGFGAGVLFALFAEPTRASVFLGLWLALGGEALRTWASGTIVKNELLATEGPYAVVRNPLYLGSYLCGLGVALMGRNPWLALGFALGFPLVYGALIRKEEKRMIARYGDEFVAYTERVSRFIPNMKAWPLPRASYDAHRMWHVHREWRAWLGLYAATLYLLLRSP
jgi:protein-S-isoprenylcysteine O-methyltransferase Ste14